MDEDDISVERSCPPSPLLTTNASTGKRQIQVDWDDSSVGQDRKKGKFDEEECAEKKDGQTNPSSSIGNRKMKGTLENKMDAIAYSEGRGKLFGLTCDMGIAPLFSDADVSGKKIPNTFAAVSVSEELTFLDLKAALLKEKPTGLVIDACLCPPECSRALIAFWSTNLAKKWTQTSKFAKEPSVHPCENVVLLFQQVYVPTIPANLKEVDLIKFIVNGTGLTPLKVKFFTKGAAITMVTDREAEDLLNLGALGTRNQITFVRSIYNNRELKLWLGWVPQTSTEAEIRQALLNLEFGVSKVEIVTDKVGASRGFCFVTFHDKKDRAAALLEKQIILCGKRVAFAEPRSARNDNNEQ